MIISPGDWDLQHWLDGCDAEEEKKAKPKPFIHRMSASKCPSCRLAVTVHGREVCEASGQTTTDTTGISDCAYLPRERTSDD